MQRFKLERQEEEKKDTEAREMEEQENEKICRKKNEEQKW